jgi:peptide/nickel transport system permease protein
MSFLRFIFGRLVLAMVTLLIITGILYAIMMLQTPEERAALFLPRNANLHMTEQQMQNYLQLIIKKNGLNDPYPVQYVRWLSKLLQGDWGYSMVTSSYVLDELSNRAPVTIELTMYTLLLMIPTGLVSGAIAGWKRNQVVDFLFRISAFVGASFPSFVLALLFLAIFYVGLYWFAPERLGIQTNMIVNSAEFRHFTGLVTIDGLLNGRIDITLDAFRHLVMPVLTLSLFHWATLGRVVRAIMIDESQKEYIVTAKSKGLSGSQILWRHPFRNVLSPALASSALSAASLVGGVFVVERIFNFHGVSEIVFTGLLVARDTVTGLGYTIYNVLMVLVVMLLLDILRGIVDPRARAEWATE